VPRYRSAGQEKEARQDKKMGVRRDKVEGDFFEQSPSRCLTKEKFKLKFKKINLGP